MLLKGKAGQAAVEYALLVCVIAAACAGIAGVSKLLLTKYFESVALFFSIPLP